MVCGLGPAGKVKLAPKVKASDESTSAPAKPAAKKATTVKSSAKEVKYHISYLLCDQLDGCLTDVATPL